MKRTILLFILCISLVGVAGCSLRSPSAEDLALLRQRVEQADEIVAVTQRELTRALAEVEKWRGVVEAVGGEQATQALDAAVKYAERTQELLVVYEAMSAVTKEGLKDAENAGGGWLSLVGIGLGIAGTVVTGGKWAVAIRIARSAVAAAETFKKAGDQAAQADPEGAAAIMNVARDRVRAAQTADHTRDAIMGMRNAGA